RLLPVIQTYNAYTSELDRKNADFLSGKSRPRFVLNEPGLSTDGRDARFESPDAVLQVLCHYRVVYSGPRWQLLESTGDRCGKPEKIKEQRVAAGEVVRVPAATDDSVVVAKFDGIADRTLDALRTFFYKAREIYLRDGKDRSIRFVPGHQQAPHVVAAPDCAVSQLGTKNLRRMKLTDRSGDSEPYEVT